MEIYEFEEMYKTRTKKYASNFARKWKLPHLAEDLHQACWIAICENLKYWKVGSDLTPHKSPFNFLAGPMRKQMERVLRTEHNLKPNSRGPIQNPFISSSFDPSISYNLDRMIDLKNAIENDPKPKEVAKFVLLTINPQDRDQFAKINKRTRQGIGLAVRKTKKRLLEALA